MFGGSTEALLMTLVETQGIGSKDLERLSKVVAEAERRENASGPAARLARKESSK